MASLHVPGRYVRTFVISDVADVHLAFNGVLRKAEELQSLYGRLGGRRSNVLRARATTQLDELRIAYAKFNDELDVAAKDAATDAVQRMRRQLKVTASRPATNKGARHLNASLKARPLYPLGQLATGTVGVADIVELDKVVNPLGPQYGPYWRAQEEGSTKQVGRVIRGFFMGPGYTGGERPLAQYAGGGGPHPIFVTARQQQEQFGGVGFTGGAGARGGLGGFGTIRHPIKPRHFIRDGADAAHKVWEGEIRQVQAQALARLTRAMAG